MSLHLTCPPCLFINLHPWKFLCHFWNSTINLQKFVPILNMIIQQYLTILNTYLSIKFWVLQKRVIWFAKGFLQLPAKLRDCHSFSLILFNLTLAKHITQIICYWKEFYYLTRQQKKKSWGSIQWPRPMTFLVSSIPLISNHKECLERYRVSPLWIVASFVIRIRLICVV